MCILNFDPLATRKQKPKLQVPKPSGSGLRRSFRLGLALLALLLLSANTYAQTNWNQVIKIVASDRERVDNFGQSVAIDGNYAIVGVPEEEDDVNGQDTKEDAGSAYLFELDSTTGNWSQVQKIVASDRDEDDEFGYSVSIGGDYAIVGAPFESEDASGLDTKSNAGSAYIFERNASGTWSEVQKIVASDRYDRDRFGYSVSISGNYAIVGAEWEDHDTTGGNSKNSAGSAYLFERNATTGNWSEVQKIVASDRDGSDYFGHSVSISGNYAIVGAFGEEEDASGQNTQISAGSAYIFERNASGTWNEVQKIVAPDRASYDEFGYSVAISGSYAIVGAYQEDEDASGINTKDKAGSAYIFELGAGGKVSVVWKIAASDRDDGDWFGNSVDISGNYAIVGAIREDEDANGNNSKTFAGSAYIFERLPNGAWSQVQKIVAPDRDRDYYDSFGASVAIDSSGYAIVGATDEGEDPNGQNSLFKAGSAYIFEPGTISSNDLCTNAISVVSGDTVNGTTRIATSSGAPSFDCGTSITAPGIWYQFSGNGNLISLDLCSGTNFDTKLFVFSGSCGSLQCVDGNDDNCGVQSRVEFVSQTETTYYIYVSGFDLDNAGDFQLAVNGTEITNVEEADEKKADAPRALRVVIESRRLRLVRTKHLRGQATQVRLYDLTGREVLHRRIQPQQSISVGHLPEGAYLYQLSGSKDKGSLQTVRGKVILR